MGKVHKSLRIEEGLSEAVKSLSLEGESEAATYSRVIQAGVTSLQAQDGDGQPVEGGQGDAALVASLQAHIDTLKAANDELSGQLAVKDEQIKALSVLTAQAQELHGAAVKGLEPSSADRDGAGEQTDTKRRGFWSRLFG